MRNGYEAGARRRRLLAPETGGGAGGAAGGTTEAGADGMTAEAREAELQRREAEITRRELRAQALEALAAEQMPAELAALLQYEDAARYSASLETLRSVWRSALQQGLEARVKGTAPRTGTTGRRAATLREAIEQKYARQ